MARTSFEAKGGVFRGGGTRALPSAVGPMTGNAAVGCGAPRHGRARVPPRRRIVAVTATTDPGVAIVTGAARPIDAVVRIPGSKSITNRALLAAALADG